MLVSRIYERIYPRFAWRFARVMAWGEKGVYKLSSQTSATEERTTNDQEEVGSAPWILLYGASGDCYVWSTMRTDLRKA